VIIQKRIKPPDTTFEDYYAATYAQFASQNLGFIPVSEGTLTINRISALENVYKINLNGQKRNRIIWILKNNRIYIIAVCQYLNLTTSEKL